MVVGGVLRLQSATTRGGELEGLCWINKRCCWAALTSVCMKCVSGREGKHGMASSSIVKEGLSCIYVGPLETADKERLEALYQQARESYYNGQPLIVDDMFDKVEVRLRWYRSKLVLKYPRCSLKRFSAYADAEVDPSQVCLLGGIWFMLLASGLIAATGSPICALNVSCRNIIRFRIISHGITPTSEAMMTISGLLASMMGILVGIPVAVAAVRALQDLLRGELVALKGYCPNCGEEFCLDLQMGLDYCSGNFDTTRRSMHLCVHVSQFYNTKQSAMFVITLSFFM